MPTSPQAAADALSAAVVGWLDEFAQQGLVITDANLVIRKWNRWLEVNTGYPAAGVIGRPLFEAFPDLAARGFEPYYRSALVGEIQVLAQGFHRYLIAPDGGDFRNLRQSGRIAPLWSGGTIIGTVTVIDDVAERVAAERELRAQIEVSERARAVAEEAVRVKDEFLATLSHEMRTPLNAVIGWTQILRASPLEPERTARALEVIERNAAAQVRLIEDMLDTARIMSGKMRLEARPVDLHSIALAAIDVVSPTAAARGVAIEHTAERTVMPMVGDPDRLQQITWNLLTNAIKFTPPGGRVSLVVERVRDMLKLSVADNGAGISPEFLPHIFKRFNQGDRSSNQRHAGLGLGLALVRQLVELHGGHIAVSSEPGAGSTFTVTFPSPSDLCHVTGGGATDVGGTADGSALAAIRILLVEPDPDERELLCAALEQHGATVVALGSAESALPILHTTERPQVIVVSACGGDPEAALVRVLEMLSAGATAIPAIAVTSDEHVDKQAGLLAAGYRVHLTKPLSTQAVVSSVLGAARRG